jgi:hypothetical protein
VEVRGEPGVGHRDSGKRVRERSLALLCPSQLHLDFVVIMNYVIHFISLIV